MSADRIRVGLISDTHGLLRPAATAFLEGCSRIIHGGDIGGANILQSLQAIAPVSAVRGNNDTDAWAAHLKDAEFIDVQGRCLYAIHDLHHMDIDPAARGVRVVISGHSHKPLIQERDGVIFVNPGSAGPRRFKLPISLGEVIFEGAKVWARIVEL